MGCSVAKDLAFFLFPELYIEMFTLEFGLIKQKHNFLIFS